MSEDISAAAKEYLNPHNAKEIAWDEQLGLYVRKSSTDRRVSLQMYQYDALPIRDGDVVLDLGGNIGAFAMYALSNGAQKVVSFEPEPGNFSMLTRNHNWFRGQLVASDVLPSRFSGKEWEIYERAVVGPNDPNEISLSVNRGPNQGCHSIAPIDFENGTTIKVKTAKLAPIIQHFQPRVAKVDIEGAEYSTLLFGGARIGESKSFGPFIWPDSIRAVAIELHFHHRQIWRDEWAPALIEEFETQGFGSLQLPEIKPNSWYGLAVFVR